MSCRNLYNIITPNILSKCKIKDVITCTDLCVSPLVHSLVEGEEGVPPKIEKKHKGNKSLNTFKKDHASYFKY